MRIEPTIPFQIAQAYAVQSRPVGPVVKVPPVQTPGRSPRLAGVVAAVVPGRVDFSGPQAQPSGPAIPMYRHPADRNAAATSVSAGRMIDVTG